MIVTQTQLGMVECHWQVFGNVGPEFPALNTPGFTFFASALAGRLTNSDERECRAKWFLVAR